MVNNVDVKEEAFEVPKATNICAVVVVYYPDVGLEARLKRVLSQVARAVVVDNTPQPITVSMELQNEWGEQLHLISNKSNKGIATAINQGLHYAADHGFTWLLTLDQDSKCHTEMVATFAEVYAACPFVASVIGSNYYDPTNKTTKFREKGSLNWMEQKTVITSGSLINIALSKQIGGMRDDYFIDQVDHEFCLRARRNGARIIITRKSIMDHSVGLPGGVVLPCIGTLPNHSTIRKYYITRNTITTILDYWKTEPIWCIKRTLKLLLGLMAIAILEESRVEKIIAFRNGMFDGIQKRMGEAENIY
jgi:rhamnosyltransferase